MYDQKARLKAMINHMIEKNDEAATTEFHSYLATKMQSALEKVSTAGASTDDQTQD